MNTTSHTHQHSDAGLGDQPAGAEAVARSVAGTEGWEDAVRLQRWARPDHADFYALAGELVATVQALEDLTHILHRQVTGYGHGRRLYDDTRGAVDPAVRLTAAAAELTLLGQVLATGQGPANRFWSAIGHIGVEPPEPGEHAEDGAGIEAIEDLGAGANDEGASS
jgi:hypothetical protein